MYDKKIIPVKVFGASILGKQDLKPIFAAAFTLYGEVAQAVRAQDS